MTYRNLLVLIATVFVFVIIYSIVLDLFDYDIKFTCGFVAGSLYYEFLKKK